MAERGKIWTDDEIAALFAAWSEDTIQRQLLGATRNNVAWRAIADALRSQGFDRDFKQCREKMKQLKKKYKETVDRLRKSGVGVKSDDDLDDSDIFVSFKWFHELHAIMRRRAVVNPPSLYNSSSLSTNTSTANQQSIQDVTDYEEVTPEAVSDEQEPSLRSPTPMIDSDNQVGTPTCDVPVATTPTSNDEQQSPDLQETTARSDQEQTPAPSSSSTTTTDRQAGPSMVSRPKKRKVTKLEKVEKANKAMMEMFIETQETSLKKMMELEAERMKWEEDQARREDEKERRFLEFMKDMFMMTMPPPMGPPMPLQMPFYPPGSTTAPPNIDREGDEHEQ